MLSKLLKYEFKSTARIFLPLYPALLLVALLNKLMYSVFQSSSILLGIPKALLSTVYGAVLVGMLVISFLMMIQRFYKNLLCDEGYLMFTLPVKSNVLILSKLIVSIVWNVASGIIAVISVIILLPDYQFLAILPRELSQLNSDMLFTYGIGIWPLAFALIVLIFASLVFSTLMIYVSIALGHLLGRYRIVAAFAAYLVVSTITEAILMIGVGIWGTIENNSSYNSFDLLERYSNIPMVVLVAMLVITAIFVIFSAIYFYATKRILDNKLNLDG